MKPLLARVVAFLASFRLAVALFVLLLVVVFVGTIEQRTMSLYEVQNTYFSSLYFVYRVGDVVPVPFPGGALLLGLLCVNLIVGGMVRIRWKKTTLGVLVVHFGILALLVGGLVEYSFSQKGFLRLFEHESGARFLSYEEWDVAIVRRGEDPKEWIVPGRLVESASGGHSVRATAPDLPFDLVLSGYSRNTEVRLARGPKDGIDGVEMTAVSSSTLGGEGNTPGLVAAISPKAGASSRTAPYARSYLRGDDNALAWTHSWKSPAASGTYDIAMRRRSFEIPFETRLDRFVHVLYPGTQMAKEYSSYVTVTEAGVGRDVKITMNEPLRTKGMIFYQSSFGNTSDGKVYSVFAVVYNPSDRVPLIACSIIGLGMVLHFGRRLEKYLKAEAALRARRALEAVDGDDGEDGEDGAAADRVGSAS